jgi:hypothetical protein
MMDRNQIAFRAEARYGFTVADPSSFTTIGVPAPVHAVTESLRKFAAIAHVSREMLERDPEETKHLVQSDLRHRILRDVAKAGRQVHGEIEFTEHEDHLRHAVAVRATAMTSQRQDGEWPAIWAAYHEDEEDRRKATREPL